MSKIKVKYSKYVNDDSKEKLIVEIVYVDPKVISYVESNNPLCSGIQFYTNSYLHICQNSFYFKTKLCNDSAIVYDDVPNIETYIENLNHAFIELSRRVG